MASTRVQNGPFTVVAHRGDAKTLLAVDLATATARTRLAGFTIKVQPPGGAAAAYYVRNKLTFKDPTAHTQDPNEPAQSSLNAPIHRFRWVHHPGLYHQGLDAAMGTYGYTVTPRYFDAQRSLLPLDPALGATVKIKVDRFTKGKVAVGFTRGFVQSQAFVDHFGTKVRIQPAKAGLLWDTAQVAGASADGTPFTYEDQQRWLGFTARDRVYALLDAVLAAPHQTVDVFAYDLNDPGFAQRLLDLGAAGRARVILDDAALHHTKVLPLDVAKRKSEDEFARQFAAAAPGQIKRGHFSRFSHDKVLLVHDGTGPKRVLTGSTNFSTSGLYVNSNHVLVFDDRTVAKGYRDVFEAAWAGNVTTKAFEATALSSGRFPFSGTGVPTTSITFSPHANPFAREVLQGLASRVDAERTTAGKPASVLFAVMGLDGAKDNPVYTTLKDVHTRTDVFSYGISDTPEGIALYQPGQLTGVLVTGKPLKTVLPAPFNQVPNIGLFHQVHHKFVVCGVLGDDPVVYCGSSNLALQGEEQNGDNLLEIHDADLAMVFAIEALELVDHFEFLDGQSTAAASAPGAGWFLGTTDRWVAKYFDTKDSHSVDRTLFVG